MTQRIADQHVQTDTAGIISEDAMQSTRHAYAAANEAARAEPILAIGRVVGRWATVRRQ
jgi:hypothetical protein